ncbi:MAG: hypothetical protein ACMUIA_01615 [bacterium]
MEYGRGAKGWDVPRLFLWLTSSDYEIFWIIMYLDYNINTDRACNDMDIQKILLSGRELAA